MTPWDGWGQPARVLEQQDPIAAEGGVPSGAVDIYAGIEEMRPRIASGDWKDLERAYEAMCRETDARAASAISFIDLAPYASALEASLEAVGKRIRPATAAVYWEFDPDNGWQSNFYECRTYRPEVDGDDDWASDFDPSTVIDGPAMPDLAARLAPTWNGTVSDTARNLYLIARTMAAFGRASAAWLDDAPLCAGFHDQSIVFRFAPTG